MQFTHRTLLRHAAVGLALALMPFAVMEVYGVIQWYYYHGSFFTILVVTATAIGVAAHHAVVRGLPARWLPPIPTVVSDEAGRVPLRLYLRRLLHAWATCSRCVAYWTAALITAALSLAMWPVLSHSAWAVVLRTMYFAVIAGSLAGAVAVGMYLFFDRAEAT